MVSVQSFSRSAVLCSGDIHQPLIRLCGGDREPRSAFRDFSIALKALSVRGLGYDEKLAVVDSALAAAARLQQVRSDPEWRLFKYELLQVAAANESSAMLFEELAEAGLGASGLRLWPRWDTTTELSLPEIAEIESAKQCRSGSTYKVEREISSQVADAWSEAVAVVVNDASDGAVAPSFAECMAALRCHVLLMAHGGQSIELKTVEARLTTFLREGLDRWNQILHRLQLLDVEPAQALEETWGAPLQRWVLMRLQHQVATQAGLTLPVELGPRQQSGSGVHMASKSSRQVIHGPIPSSASREDAAGLAELEPLTKPVAVRAMPSVREVDAIEHTLRAEFPWAEQTADRIGKLLRVRSLFGSPDLALPPILLVGSPGCGKSRLARRLAELLDLPFHPISIGGSTDAKQLLGTSRGWGGACASPLLIPLLANKTASGLVLLDEIDKAGRNGDAQSNMMAALLGFLEPETAARHHDPFLQTTCDFSRLLFIATANSLKMPKALLSRFQILYVPEPRKQDMLAIARCALIDMAKDLGIPVDFLPEPPAHLLEQSGGNARSLKALLMGFLHEWACMHLDPARLN